MLLSPIWIGKGTACGNILRFGREERKRLVVDNSTLQWSRSFRIHTKSSSQQSVGKTHFSSAEHDFAGKPCPLMFPIGESQDSQKKFIVDHWERWDEENAMQVVRWIVLPAWQVSGSRLGLTDTPPLQTGSGRHTKWQACYQNSDEDVRGR